MLRLSNVMKVSLMHFSVRPARAWAGRPVSESSTHFCRGHSMDDVIHHLNVGISVRHATRHNRQFQQFGARLCCDQGGHFFGELRFTNRSEEHTSELQSPYVI